MRTTPTLALLSLALTAVLASVSSSAEEYYKWVDDQGVTHYGQRPPKNTAASRGETSIGHSAPSHYPSEQFTDNQKENTSAAKSTEKQQNQKDPERCKAAKDNLNTINTSSRIKVKGEDGQFNFLTPKEIAERKKDAQKAIGESC